MKALFLSVLVFSSAAFAGDGGYTNITCTSASGRTILSIFNDNYTGSDQPATIRLIIDGQMAEYKSSAEVYNPQTETWEPADPNAPLVIWNDNSLVVKDGSVALDVSIKRAWADKKYSATIKAGYKDPRLGTAFEYAISSNSAIALNCIEFYQSP